MTTDTSNIPPGAAPARGRTARPARRRRWGILLLFVVILAAGGWWVWRANFQTYHLATVQPGMLYRSGNRSIAEFKTAVRRARVKTVVCLIDDRELADPGKGQFREELAFGKEQGIDVERLPVALGGWPTARDVKDFLRIASDPNRQPVLVHCAQGVRRTGMMAAAYQRAVLGYTPQQARAAVLTFGHSSRTIADVERFIDEYDPTTGAVPAGPAGEE